MTTNILWSERVRRVLLEIGGTFIPSRSAREKNLHVNVIGIKPSDREATTKAIRGLYRS